jgi:hypothetical protein
MGPDAFTVRCLIFELFENIYKNSFFEKCNVVLEWSSTPVAHMACESQRMLKAETRGMHWGIQ